MAQEIKRVVAYTGGMLKYGDFAVLRECKVCIVNGTGALSKDLQFDSMRFRDPLKAHCKKKAYLAEC